MRCGQPFVFFFARLQKCGDKEKAVPDQPRRLFALLTNPTSQHHTHKRALSLVFWRKPRCGGCGGALPFCDDIVSKQGGSVKRNVRTGGAMEELSKTQQKKAKRRLRAEEERKTLRKQKVLCLTCFRESNRLAWKISGHKCPNCGGLKCDPVE